MEPVAGHAKTDSVMVPSSIDPGDLARIRAEVKQSISSHGSLDQLEIDAYAPILGIPFAFVAPTPKLPENAQHDKSLWRRCSYCERGNQFKDGRIVYCGDGRLRLIGFDCWKSHIDEHDWNVAREEWDAYKRRDRFELIMKKLIPALEQLKSDIREVLQSSLHVISFSDNFPSTLKSVMSDIESAFQGASKNSGWLTVDRMVRKAESDNFIPLQEKYCQVRGLSALTIKNGSIRGGFDSSLACVYRALDKLKKTNWDNLSNQNFKKEADSIDTDINNALHNIDRIVSEITSVSAILSQENMSMVIKWTNDSNCELQIRSSDRYAIVPGGIRRIIDDRKYQDLAAPESFSVPDIPSIRWIKNIYAGKAHE